MSDHAITIDFDGGLGPHVTFACIAPEGAICHAVWTCDCESWVRSGVTDGVPWHSDHDPDDPLTASTERHVGTLDAAYCGLRDWFDAGDGEDIHGKVTVPVKPIWEPEYVRFEIGSTP